MLFDHAGFRLEKTLSEHRGVRSVWWFEQGCWLSLHEMKRSRVRDQTVNHPVEWSGPKRDSKRE